MKLSVLVLLAELLLANAAVAVTVPELSLTGQPRSYVIAGTPYKIDGYGRAHFGMSAAQVKAAIAAEFPNSSATLKQSDDPVDRTQAIAIVVPHLAPGPGPATVSYVFGATTHKLIAVNLYWLAEGNPSNETRQKLLASGTSLAADLVGHQWPLFATVRGQVAGPGALILFSGSNAAGAGISIGLDGIAFDVEKPAGRNGQRLPPEHRPAPSGPAELRFSLVANVAKPDVYRIPPGAF